MKAIIADIDDTICPSTQPIKPEMAREIERIIRGGRIFAFISGSTLEQISAQITPFIKAPHHLLGASGTHYVKIGYKDGQPQPEEIHRQAFSDQEKVEILAAFEALMEKFDIRTLTTREDQLQDRGSQITLSAIGRHAPQDKKRALDPEGTRRKIWVEFLKPLLGEKYSIRIGGTSSVDITPLGIDKAWGINKFLEHNKLMATEVLFLGDKLGPEGNDYPALKVVDCLQVKNPGHALEILRCFLTCLNG
jgi:HAD superfamily hydrolase (TIGR01484 family)